MRSERSVLAATASRVGWVDTGRGLAIVLVVLYHSTNWLAGTGLAVGLWADVSAVLSSMRMPFFFVLSGMFAAKWLTDSWGSLLRVKVLLFAWVFAVWQVIGTVVFPLGLLSADKPVGMTGLVKSLLLSPVSPRFELWFIWALALFFVAAKATRRVDRRIQLAVSGLVACVGLTLWADVTTGWTGSAKFYFFFLAGLYGRRLLLGFGGTQARWPVAAVVVSWLAASLLLVHLELRGVFGLYFLTCALGVGAGVAVSRGLSGVGWIGRTGRRTLPIYLTHTPLIIVVAFLVSLPPVIALLGPVGVLLPPIVAGVAVVVSLALHRSVEHGPLRVLYGPPEAVVRRLACPRR